MELLSDEFNEFSSELLFHALELIDDSDLSSCSDDSERLSVVLEVPNPKPHAASLVQTAAKRRTSKSELERLRSDVHRLEKTLVRLKGKSLRSTSVAPDDQISSEGSSFCGWTWR